MGFIGVYRAVYDYAATADGEDELGISEGDLLFVLEKGDDGWWRAKKKALSEDDDEPEGVVPSNYVEEAKPTTSAKALYDYTRQTDEELSFAEDDVVNVYDTTDPDWTLVGFKGEYGFVPANYIEASEAPPATPARSRTIPPTPRAEELQDRASLAEPPSPASPSSNLQSPAAALAGIIQSKTSRPTANGTTKSVSIASPPLPTRQPQYTPEESEEEAPAPRLPSRPLSQSVSPPAATGRVASPRSPEPETPGVLPSPPYNRGCAGSQTFDDIDPSLQSPRGFHLYNIHEMVEAIGKNKKMPVTLGINVAKGVIMISPEQSRESKEWTADKLTHYALEGKHVFVELVRPSKSIDFHAGAKDTAQEIVSHLGDLAGASRAEGLREVFAAGAGSRQKKGKMLYDFISGDDDEVTVGVDDEVIILDDTKSDEWWRVRRLKSGKEGVVPSSYVEITGTVAGPSAETTAALSFVDQNRQEEERLTKQAVKQKRQDSRTPEVGPGLQLPERGSSLSQDDKRKSTGRGSKRENRDAKSSEKKTMPDMQKIRTWTDRSGSFKVEAEYLGLKDGKIHLHKLNGVKIAVPVAKMAIEDLEYVERASGVSLDEDKPLSDIRRKNTQRANERPEEKIPTGASVGQRKTPEYDWFDFFLQCGVSYQICVRYAASFTRDHMGEENLPDITPQLLRTLGLREGDILRVMKFLDNKFGRKRNIGVGEEDGPADANGEGGADGGGLFSGPGGALRNNTRKGRPAAPVQTSSTVDPKVFEQKGSDAAAQPTSDATATPSASAPPPKEDLITGFDDNAWEPRATKQTPASSGAAPAAASAATATNASAAPTAPATIPSSALGDLSLLSAPLQPTPAVTTPPQAQPTAPETSGQPQGASPSLFEQLAKSPANPALQNANINQQQQQFALTRQRPQAPQQTGQNALIAPPPPRAASAPNNFNQPSAFGPPPLQPQLTGYQPQQQQGLTAPPGQSLQEQLQRLQLQQQQPSGLQPPSLNLPGFPGSGPSQLPNGIAPQVTGFPGTQFQPSLQISQPTGYNPQLQQQLLAGQQVGSPFADPSRLPYQPTGVQNTFQPLQPQATGVNAFLPPALLPQPTGASQSTFNPRLSIPGQSFSPPPVPPIPQQQTPQPLVPQKTGPPPPVRFGVQPGAKKLTPQPTGRRANLAHATPQNPFGF